jgi:hypothetical protein
MPAIIAFLRYKPLPAAKTWAERLVRDRVSLGITQGEAARELGVDPGTLAKWERGERKPAEACGPPEMTGGGERETGGRQGGWFANPEA